LVEGLKRPPSSSGVPPAPRPPQTIISVPVHTAVARSRALGAPTVRILWRHVLPNLVSPITVQGTFIFAYAVLAEAALSFLGVGVPPEIPTWGTMVAGSQAYAHQALWIVLFPGLAIIVTALSLQVLGDGIRDLLDPRLRRTA
jgi:peptide/nickel transport system permease protein